MFNVSVPTKQTQISLAQIFVKGSGTFSIAPSANLPNSFHTITARCHLSNSPSLLFVSLNFGYVRETRHFRDPTQTFLRLLGYLKS